MIAEFLANALNIKTLTEIISVLIALTMAVKGVIEYQKQGAQKRTELFFQMRDRYEKYRYICTLLDERDIPASMEKLHSLSWAEKRDFVAFFEELALITVSGLIKPSVTHYMFGFSIIKCADADEIWNEKDGLPRSSKYWALFHSFAGLMRQESKKQESRSLKLRNFKL